LREFLKKNNASTHEEQPWEAQLAWAIYLVEKECGQRIDKDYPLLKFYSLVENLQKDYKQQERDLRKAKR